MFPTFVVPSPTAGIILLPETLQLAQVVCTPACSRDISSDLLADNSAPPRSFAPTSRILKGPWLQHRVIAEFALRLGRAYVSPPHSSTEAPLQQYYSIRSWLSRGQCPGLGICRFNRTSYTLSGPSNPDVLDCS
jgi:hypothetical protein